jgi:hypothetical protein
VAFFWEDGVSPKVEEVFSAKKLVYPLGDCWLSRERSLPRWGRAFFLEKAGLPRFRWEKF